MSLLHEIQTAAMQEASMDVGPVLLKLRFLASRLGSDLLEEWVTYEMDGYPKSILVPDYRKVGVSYTGTFSDMVTTFNEVPIPSHSIQKYADERWVRHEMRHGIAVIDDLIRPGKHGKNTTLQIDAANLILLLQDKIYKGMACLSITGLISVSALAAIQFSVRKRVLELTIQIEKAIPAAEEISVGGQLPELSAETAKATTHITHQTIYTDNYTVISNSSTGTQSVSVSNIRKGDIVAFEKALTEGGIAEVDASELAKIISEEQPQSKEEPFGVRAKAWIADNLGKSAKGSWKIGKELAMKLLTEAVMQYYFKTS